MSLRPHPFALLLPLLLPGCGCGGGDPDGPLEILAFTTDLLPDGRVGAPYAAVIAARGGRAPYVFRGGAGRLPPGLALAEEGLLAGTPEEEGDSALDVVVTDAAGDRAQRSFSIRIAPAEEPPRPLRIMTAALPTGDLGEPYEATLEAEGGTPPLRWSIGEGAPPEGLSLSEDGLLSGVPETLGRHELTVRLEDAGGESVAAAFEIAISPAPELLTEVLPIAVVGEPYHAQLEVAGGSWPLVFEAYSGRLPAGLTLHPSGLVAGVAEEPDSRPVRFRVTDAAGAIREQRIRIWAVEDTPWEAFVGAPMPPNCGLAGEPIVVRGTVQVTDPAMIARVQVAVDVRYADMGMADIDVVAPDGTRVPLHVGGPRAGGSIGIHFLYESDRISWGSFRPLLGMGPAGTWTLEVRVLPDPGFGCVDEPGALQRFAVVLGGETSSEDYLRVRGVVPNNLIDGPFARIAGGGLEQSSFDLLVEEWSAGPNRIPEGGTGDDVLLGTPDTTWSTDLPAEVGAFDASGHFQSGEATGQGTLTGVVGERTLELPVKVVPPDWVP